MLHHELAARHFPSTVVPDLGDPTIKIGGDSSPVLVLSRELIWPYSASD